MDAKNQTVGTESPQDTAPLLPKRYIPWLGLIALAQFVVTVAISSAVLAPHARAADLSKPVTLVAKPGLQDALFGASVLVVTPDDADRHIGFIVNRPTGITFAGAFPEHGAAQKVTDPIYLGGPFASGLLFALVQQADSPGGQSLELMPGLFVAYEDAIIDAIVDEPQGARFVAGLVAWEPGELREQIDQGAWYVLPADAAVALHEPEGLWQELVQRYEMAANAI
jgi:putative transcriptional regulator